jgi:hypothetical protein
LETCLLQLRIFGKQVAVGVIAIGPFGKADHLEIFDLHRFVAGLGLNYEDLSIVGQMA